MLTPDLHPEAVKLFERMTGQPPSHPRFAGVPIDVAQLDALSLGDLWATADAIISGVDSAAAPAVEAARAIIQRGRELEPAFRGIACRDYLDLLIDRAEKRKAAGTHYVEYFLMRDVCFALSHCIDLTSDDLRAVAGRALTAISWSSAPHIAVALARLAGSEAAVLDTLATDLVDSPLFLEEVRTTAALDLPANIVVADWVCRGRDSSAASLDPEHCPLSAFSGYVAFAEIGLKMAVNRVRKIHDLEAPYASDKAFTLGESAVIGRLARVALDRDEAWVPSVLGELFHKVGLAPTAAKTVPSQSVAIALGHAIETFPTPEAVETLRAVVGTIRHAGVKKKLQRNLPTAARGLAFRPEIALRLPVDQPFSKHQIAIVTRCLEAGFVSSMTFTSENWRLRLAERTQLKSLTESLVWRLHDPGGGSIAVLPVSERGRATLQNVTGAPVAILPDHSISLWHPADASAGEREAWRSRLALIQLRQPFKQVFREHYVVSAEESIGDRTAMFSGHIVSITPFLGLARREGWRSGYRCLTHHFGRWTAELDLADNIYPGVSGGTAVGNLSLRESTGRSPLPVSLGDVPPATLSEILRAVDLLVSVGGFAVATEDPDRHYQPRIRSMAVGSLGAMLEMRKQALAQALRGVSGMQGVQFNACHLLLGDYAVHLATGRATCRGEPVSIDTPRHSNLAAVPWLPYDEKLLEEIYYTAIEIASRVRN